MDDTAMAASPIPQPKLKPKPKPKPKPKYPGGVPNKFAADGSVQPFPGNTIVLRLAPSSPLHSSLLELHEKLRSSPLAHLYALLPPESWHMTIFEGVTDKVRQPNKWASDLPTDTPLDDMTRHLCERVQRASFEDDAKAPFLLAFRGWKPLIGSIGMYIGNADDAPEEEARVRRLRDKLSEATRIKSRTTPHIACTWAWRTY